LLRGKRVGLLTHPAAVLPDCTYLVDRLIDDDDVNLVLLFAPEHGLAADAQDQVAVGGQTYRGLPVVSLYGDDAASLRPTEEALEKIDVLVVDLQDVGARYYTYVYTMAYCLEACGKAGVPLIVCDRPNPLNGVAVQGQVLDPAFASFVGRFALPVRHGMTIGELARMWNAEEQYDADLTVLASRGWRRAMWFDQCGLPWVPPSPNMPALSTAIVYPGGCLLEGTNLSEGRGTTRPFETIGAPFIDGREWASTLNERGLPGCVFRPIVFQPTFHKHAGEVCGGVFVHVTDRDNFDATRAYWALIEQARRLAPEDFAWRTEPYEFESDRLAIDLLAGTDRFRLALETGEDVESLFTDNNDAGFAFAERRASFLKKDYANGNV